MYVCTVPYSSTVLSYAVCQLCVHCGWKHCDHNNLHSSSVCIRFIYVRISYSKCTSYLSNVFHIIIFCIDSNFGVAWKLKNEISNAHVLDQV